MKFFGDNSIGVVFKSNMKKFTKSSIESLKNDIEKKPLLEKAIKEAIHTQKNKSLLVNAK